LKAREHIAQGKEFNDFYSLMSEQTEKESIDIIKKAIDTNSDFADIRNDLVEKLNAKLQASWYVLVLGSGNYALEYFAEEDDKFLRIQIA
jgi:aspartate aminotransferase-like enzyme